MSWDEYKEERDRTEFLDVMLEVNKIRQVLNTHFGDLGSELPLSERVELVLTRQSDQIAELHYEITEWETRWEHGA
jgi:hypothetical protein